MKTWFLVGPDDVTGLALQTGATAAIESAGGRVQGFARHPADAETVVPALTSARDSDAGAIGLCALGASLTTQIREARGLGLFDKNKAICAYADCINDIHTVGPLEASDLWRVTGFYWNQNDRTRSFSHRFNKLTGRMPGKPYAVTYAAVERLLRPVEAFDAIDDAALNAGMRR